jgi:hypothetical protein
VRVTSQLRRVNSSVPHDRFDARSMQAATNADEALNS